MGKLKEVMERENATKKITEVTADFVYWRVSSLLCHQLHTHIISSAMFKVTQYANMLKLRYC